MSRVLILEDQIRDQIELVAELICTGECALEAVQVLDYLTRELVAEQHRQSETAKPDSSPRSG